MATGIDSIGRHIHRMWSTVVTRPPADVGEREGALVVAHGGSPGRFRNDPQSGAGIMERREVRGRPDLLERNGGAKEEDAMAGRERRGFAAMTPDKQREIARRGGRAAHQKGTAHEFSADEARAAGRKGGVAVSRDREHMSRIGRAGGLSSRAGRRNPGSSDSFDPRNSPPDDLHRSQQAAP